jgi:hypothetical protein
VRRRLRTTWPALSHLYGLHPYDLDRLTPGELDAYLTDLDRHVKALKAAERQARQRRM